jgi:hypothetical protein
MQSVPRDPPNLLPLPSWERREERSDEAERGPTQFDQTRRCLLSEPLIV